MKVLTTNGGGTLGLYELMILSEIESKYCTPHNKTLRDYFDLIVGCSSGALTAAAIALGIPLITMIDPLKAVAGHIFPKDSNVVSKTVRLIKTASGEAYDYKRMKDVCKFFLQASLMKDVPNENNLCIIAYSLDKNAPRIFSNHQSTEDQSLSLVDVVMAACSIPTGFPPYKIGTQKYCDGFPFADDSSLYAQMKVLEEHPGKCYSILTVGNIVQSPKESCGSSLLNGDHVTAMVHMTTQCAFLRSRKTVEKLCSLTNGRLFYINCLEFPTTTTVMYNNSDDNYLAELTKCASVSWADFSKRELLDSIFSL